jgi:hypothetical protein
VSVLELVEQSAQVALLRAAELQQRMRDAEDAGDDSMAECCAEMRRLVGDVATLRNAAMLLQRQPRIPA